MLTLKDSKNAFRPENRSLSWYDEETRLFYIYKDVAGDCKFYSFGTLIEGYNWPGTYPISEEAMSAFITGKCPYGILNMLVDDGNISHIIRNACHEILTRAEALYEYEEETPF